MTQKRACDICGKELFAHSYSLSSNCGYEVRIIKQYGENEEKKYDTLGASPLDVCDNCWNSMCVWIKKNKQ